METQGENNIGADFCRGESQGPFLDLWPGGVVLLWADRSLAPCMALCCTFCLYLRPPQPVRQLLHVHMLNWHMHDVSVHYDMFCLCVTDMFSLLTGQEQHRGEVCFLFVLQVGGGGKRLRSTCSEGGLVCPGLSQRDFRSHKKLVQCQVDQDRPDQSWWQATFQHNNDGGLTRCEGVRGPHAAPTDTRNFSENEVV